MKQKLIEMVDLVGKTVSETILAKQIFRVLVKMRGRLLVPSLHKIYLRLEVSHYQLHLCLQVFRNLQGADFKMELFQFFYTYVGEPMKK